MGIVLAIGIILGFLASAIGVYQFVWPLLKRHVLRRPDSEPATREDVGTLAQRIKELEGKLNRGCEYLGGLPETVNKTLKAAYEEARILQLEGYEAQNGYKHREAIDRFTRALDLAENPCQRVALHNMRGNSYFWLSEYGKAQADCEQVILLSKHIPEPHASAQAYAAALGNLGIIQFHYGHLDLAERYLRKALRIQTQIGDSLCEAIQLQSLGNVYLQRGELDKSEEHHKEALKIHREIGNREGEAMQLSGLGNVYFQRGELDKSEEHHKEALKIHREIGNREGEANALGNLGNVCDKRGDPDKAEEYYKEALGVHREIGDNLGEANGLGNLGLVYKDRDDIGNAREYLQQAHAIYQEIGACGEGPEKVQQALEELERQQQERGE